MDIALILKDLRLDANLSESKRLACAVQTQLVNATSSSSRGVKQALFHVLLGADMPSILVEAGFLNNQRDRRIITSRIGQVKVSQAIATAVDEYRAHKMNSNHSIALNRCKVN
jgi:N-acetylmuramoyl-L-alanine amidase